MAETSKQGNINSTFFGTSLTQIPQSTSTSKPHPSSTKSWLVQEQRVVPFHGQTRLVSRVFFFHPFHLNNAHGRQHLRSNVLLTGRDPTCSQGEQRSEWTSRFMNWQTVASDNEEFQPQRIHFHTSCRFGSGREKACPRLLGAIEMDAPPKPSAHTPLARSILSCPATPHIGCPTNTLPSAPLRCLSTPRAPHKSQRANRGIPRVL